MADSLSETHGASILMATGGKAAFDNPMYWMALLIALVAGFLAPLPYNYYKLEKFKEACHRCSDHNYDEI